MGRIILTLLCVFFVSASSSVQGEVKEKLIFDPSKNAWVSGSDSDLTEAPLGGTLGEAQELISNGKIRKAERQLKKYLKGNPNDADRRAAMLLYADCAFDRGRYSKADKRYKDLINEFPNTKEYAIALTRELKIAKAWLGGKKQRVLVVFRLGAEDEALDILSMIEQLGAGYRIAEVALRVKADYFFETGQFELAQMAYRRLAKEYRSRRYKERAMYRCASSALASFPGVAFDETPLIEARELYNEYLDNFPNEPESKDIEVILDQIKDKRAHKQFDVGRFYVRINKPEAAAYYFRYVARHWPKTLWASRSKSELERLGFTFSNEN